MFTLNDLRLTDKIVVVGHRGYSARFPENTLLSYREAVIAGCDMIELDVMLSADGIAVISHDDRLERVSNGYGNISDYTLAELKKYDFGIRHGNLFSGIMIPTFEEAMQLIKSYPGVLVDVDFKIGPSIWKTLEVALQIIQKLEMVDRCIFNSCDGKIVSYLRKMGFITVGAPISYKEKVNYTDETYNDLWAVCIPMDELSQNAAKYYLDRGIKVAVTSPDNADQIRYALSCGATIMIVDEPTVALRVANILNG